VINVTNDYSLLTPGLDQSWHIIQRRRLLQWPSTTAHSGG